MNCIYHIPIPLDPNAKSASGIRPQKMLQAFKRLGYEVAVVSGYANERKAMIRVIKDKINHGTKYDFLYSESSTMPTSLTEPHHMPTHPFLDFSFFYFCKRNGIKLGLFYRDIYWKFEIYKEKVHGIKYLGALMAYRYDLLCYSLLLDKLYVPNERIYAYLSEKKLQNKLDTLPPGCEEQNIDASIKSVRRDFTREPLRIFYVGGLGGQYQISEILEAVKSIPYCEMTICCREAEWNANQDTLGKYNECKNIHIVHDNGKDLEKYYLEADICSLMFKPDIYREFAMPYKAFEYLSWLKPILATKDTAIGDFVEKNDIGWSITYNFKEIQTKINFLIQNPKDIEKKKYKCLKTKKDNMWTTRVKKVSLDLK